MEPKKSCACLKCELVVCNRRTAQIVSRFGHDRKAAQLAASQLNNNGRDPDDHFYVAHNEISSSEIDEREQEAAQERV